MPKQREWTERDLLILQALYELRELTKQQVTAKYFNGNVKYANKRLYIMRCEGLIVTQVYGRRIEQHTRVAAYIRITERGMELLVAKKRIEVSSYRARDMGLTAKQRQYIIDANELHLRIPEIPFLDSRRIKKKYHLNRGDLLLGCFETTQGDYTIYMLNVETKPQTLIKIVTEIRSSKQLQVKGYLIFYKHISVKRRFVELCEQEGLVTGGIPIYLLPYDELGIDLTRWYILASDRYAYLQQVLASYGQLVRVKERDKYGFLYGLRREGEGKPPYLVEQLTGDMLTLRRNLKFYTPEISRREGHRVLVICLEEEVAHYQKLMEHERHVDVLGIPRIAVERQFKRLREEEVIEEHE